MINGERIKDLRIKAGLSQTQLAEAANTSKQSIYKYEMGIITNIPIDKVELIAKKLNTTPAYLMGWEEKVQKMSSAKQSPHLIPVLGYVRAGIPIEAIEDIIDYEEITEEMAKNGDYFGLKIKGDSMSPRIQNGDVVIVRKQESADSGDIVIALINGDDACCKKLIRRDDGVVLQSLNSIYDPMIFSNTDIEKIPVTIIGKVVELRAKF